MRKFVIAGLLALACGFGGVARDDQSLAWLDTKELKCLVDNIYHEARSEPFEGQVAVARVVLNRVGVWASTVCEVVYQRHQFSWTSNRFKPIRDQAAYQIAWQAAWMSRTYPLHATYYHSIKIKPKWARAFIPIKQINNHIFYKG